MITLPAVVVYLILMTPIVMAWWILCRWVWKNLIERPLLRKLDKQLSEAHLHVVVGQLYDSDEQRIWWETYYQASPTHQKQLRQIAIQASERNLV